MLLVCQTRFFFFFEIVTWAGQLLHNDHNKQQYLAIAKLNTINYHWSPGANAGKNNSLLGGGGRD